MNIFEFVDYRAYIKDHVRRLPKKGRGELTRIAKYLSINTTLISQIMSGLRSFNQEQTYSLSTYLGHTELETDYFSLLVQIERAGTAELKKHLTKKLNSVKGDALKLSKRIAFEKKLTDEQRAIFYSSWLYSAVHLFTSVDIKGVTIDEIAARFSIQKLKAAEILQFLLITGLCDEKSNRFTMGVQSTFVERGSPHLLRHHANWRIKAIQKSEEISEEELMYSGQFSLSKKDFEHLREHLAHLLKEINTKVKSSKAEDIAALNLDWFWIEN